MGTSLISSMVGIAQSVSAPDCGSGGPGFDSLYPPFVIEMDASVHFIMGYRQAVRHSTLTAAFASSNLASPVKVLQIGYGILAQLVEHLTFNQVVRGSNPRCLINRMNFNHVIGIHLLHEEKVTKQQNAWKRRNICFQVFLLFGHY